MAAILGTCMFLPAILEWCSQPGLDGIPSIGSHVSEPDPFTVDTPAVLFGNASRRTPPLFLCQPS